MWYVLGPKLLCHSPLPFLSLCLACIVVVVVDDDAVAVVISPMGTTQSNPYCRNLSNVHFLTDHQ